MYLKPKKKSWLQSPAVFYKSASGPISTPVKVHRGNGVAFTNVGVTDFTINIGPAAADKLMVVAISSTGVAMPGLANIGGVALTLDEFMVTGGAPITGIYSGLVNLSGSQTVEVDFGSTGFDNKAIEVWSITGLSSPLVKSHNAAGAGGGGGGQTLAVDEGDLVFCSQFSGGSASFSPDSTQAADAEYDRPDDNHLSGEWTVGAGHSGSFLIRQSGSFAGGVATSYR